MRRRCTEHHRDSGNESGKKLVKVTADIHIM
jgi:hypothetical protein